MKRNSSIEVRVTDHRKSQWEEYADRSDLTLSKFVRQAGDEKIYRSLDPEAIKSMDLAVEPDQTKLNNQLQQLIETQKQIVDQLVDLEEIPTSKNIDELMEEIDQLLLSAPDVSSFEDLELMGTEHHDLKVAIMGTADGFAEYLAEDLGFVRRALVRAERDDSDVTYTYSEDGEKQYFKLNSDLDEIQFSNEADYGGFKSATDLD